MKYKFGEYIERRNTGCSKWDNLTMRISNPNALPMWVADSDWSCDDSIVSAICKRASHPIYGYNFIPKDFGDITRQWIYKRHGWQIDSSWVVYSPGVVNSIAFAINAFTNPGDEIIIQRPVYHPFTNIVVENDRKVSSNSLIYENGQYKIDFDDLRKKAASPSAKLMLLCNPHNPVGRVWNKDELTEIAEICLENNVILVSDEIHADLIYEGYKHIPIASLDNSYLDNTITCYSPSKAFNIAGLQASSIVVSNESMRLKMENQIKRFHLEVPNVFSMLAYKAAYTECEEYLKEEISYLHENIKLMDSALRTYMPKIKVVKPEGTYLLWLDCTELGISGDALTSFFNDDCAVGINGGNLFGPEGENFVRINIACPQEIILQALEQMKKAYFKLNK